MVLFEELISHCQETVIQTEVNYGTMFTISGGRRTHPCKQSAPSERSRWDITAPHTFSWFKIKTWFKRVSSNKHLFSAREAWNVDNTDKGTHFWAQCNAEEDKVLQWSSGSCPEHHLPTHGLPTGIMLNIRHICGKGTPPTGSKMLGAGGIHVIKTWKHSVIQGNMVEPQVVEIEICILFLFKSPLSLTRRIWL